jgi:arginyl-tRNA synthetase
MVALSPAACEELGLTVSEEDRARPFIEMSGRRGVGVKADDLINRLEASALREVQSRHSDLAEAAQNDIAHSIAVGALRYFLLKFTRNSVIAFDFKEALAFEGETGTYCQNAAVRANAIFRKLPDGLHLAAEELIAGLKNNSEAEARVREILTDEAGTEVWSLVMLAERLDEVVDQCALSAEPANLAKYVFTLARAFNVFYHRHRIISEEDATKRAVLVAAADITRRQLTAGLAILGIAVPERM